MLNLPLTPTRTLKISELLAAMKENGLPLAQGDYIVFDHKTFEPVAGCIYGQAARNLNLDPAALQNGVCRGKLSEVGEQVVYLNDYGTSIPDSEPLRGIYHPSTYEEVYAKVEEVLLPFADETFEVVLTGTHTFDQFVAEARGDDFDLKDQFGLKDQ